MPKKHSKPRERTYARNRRVFSRRGYEKMFESDGEFLLKLVLCLLLASFWVKFGQPLVWGDLHINALPVGMLIGLLMVRGFERFQTDRKIWYATLVLTGILTYFYPSGIVI